MTTSEEATPSVQRSQTLTTHPRDVTRSRDLHTAERTRVLALRLSRLRRNLSYVTTGRRRSEPDDWTHRMLMDFSICIEACVYDTRRLFGS